MSGQSLTYEWESMSLTLPHAGRRLSFVALLAAAVGEVRAKTQPTTWWTIWWLIRLRTPGPLASMPNAFCLPS